MKKQREIEIQQKIKKCEENLSDQTILELFYKENEKIEANFTNFKWLSNHTTISNYLSNRYSDSDSIRETLYRIKNNVEIRPTCKICGGKVKFYDQQFGFANSCSAKCNWHLTKDKREQTLFKKFGVKNSFLSNEVKEKIKQTNINRYGCEHPTQSKEIKEKIAKTNITKYGKAYLMQVEDFKEKSKQTCLKKYNCEYSFQSENNKEKAKQTNLQKRGCEYAGQSSEVKEKMKRTCMKKYNCEYASQTKETQEKRKNTCYKKYGKSSYLETEECKQQLVEYCQHHWGCSNPAQSSEIQEKIKQTNLSKYGYEHAAQNNEIKEKTKNTNLKKYNAPYIMQVEDFKEKSKQTCLEKYNCEYSFQSENNKEKSIMSNLKKYGVKYPIQNKELQKTMYANCWSDETLAKSIYTKRKNNSFNTSKLESSFELYLSQTFPNDYKCQYHSSSYPFNCDFYIISLDLYIEIQGSWVHGGHPYRVESLSDCNQVKLWKSKNSKYYDNAIKVWTERDVKKRNIAFTNKLNYLEIFANNLDSCISILQDKIKTLK